MRVMEIGLKFVQIITLPYPIRAYQIKEYCGKNVYTRCYIQGVVLFTMAHAQQSTHARIVLY